MGVEKTEGAAVKLLVFGDLENRSVSTTTISWRSGGHHQCSEFELWRLSTSTTLSMDARCPQEAGATVVLSRLGQVQDVTSRLR